MLDALLPFVEQLDDASTTANMQTPGAQPRYRQRCSACHRELRPKIVGPSTGRTQHRYARRRRDIAGDVRPNRSRLLTLTAKETADGFRRARAKRPG